MQAIEIFVLDLSFPFKIMLHFLHLLLILFKVISCPLSDLATTSQVTVTIVSRLIFGCDVLKKILSLDVVTCETFIYSATLQ